MLNFHWVLETLCFTMCAMVKSQSHSLCASNLWTCSNTVYNTYVMSTMLSVTFVMVVDSRQVPLRPKGKLKNFRRGLRRIMSLSPVYSQYFNFCLRNACRSLQWVNASYAKNDLFQVSPCKFPSGISFFNTMLNLRTTIWLLSEQGIPPRWVKYLKGWLHFSCTVATCIT